MFFFFSFQQCQAQSSVTSLHIVATAKGCNLFGLESRSSKWSADNSPEVSFKRVPLFNYFLGDLWRQCDNETVSFTCGSDPPQPDVQSQIVLFTESFPFTLTQQIHLTESGPEQFFWRSCWIRLQRTALTRIESSHFLQMWQKKKETWREGSGVVALIHIVLLTRCFLYES